MTRRARSRGHQIVVVACTAPFLVLMVVAGCVVVVADWVCETCAEIADRIEMWGRR